MGHELQMRDPKKVVAKLEEAVDKIERIKGAVDTAAGIADMDLAIGGLNQTFRNLTSLEEPLTGAVGVFKAIGSSIEDRAREFEQANENITF